MEAEHGRLENLPPFANEPATDFSQSVHRERMQRALEEVGNQLGGRYDLWIGGEAVETATYLERFGPADHGVLVGSTAKAGPVEADRAVSAAKAAFPKWRDTSPLRRAAVLFEVAEGLRRRRFEWMAWQVYECGKQWREADGDVAEAVDFCEFYARQMLSLSIPRERNAPGEQNTYFYVPRGVCAVIAPWNFPLAILCGMTVAPLVAGNTVVVKPAEQSSVVAAQFLRILRDLDLPPGVVNFVPGIGEEVGRRLVEHPDVATLVFTGSKEVGLEINRTAAVLSEGQEHVKHVVTEMGGKNAVIIDEDADLDEAVKGVTYSAFGYQGQKCSACSRVIVLSKVYDAFARRLQEAVASLRIGPPSDPAYSVGPVIDEQAYERLLAAVERGKKEATCLFASDVGSLSARGYYIGPHLFADVAPDSFLAQVELFGPVLAILRAENLSQALEIANGTPYALTGGIYSRNPVSIDRARQEFLVGNLYINRQITGALVDRQPFGGFKLSGVGAKAGGPDYLGQFLLPRAITENTLRSGFAPVTLEEVEP